MVRSMIRLDHVEPFHVDRADRACRVHVDRRRHAAHQPVRVRILAAEDRLDLDDFLLEVERLEVVRDRHQVGFRRQLVGRVAPVAVAERPELSRLDELLQAVLQVAEVARRRHRPRRDGLRQLGRRLRVRGERAHHVHPVEGVQVIEVHQVILRIQGQVHDVADRVRVLGDLDLQRVLDRANRRQRVHAGAHAADALHERPCVARITAAEDDLQAAPHRARGHGVADDVVRVDVHLDAEVPLDARDRIDDDALARVVELEAVGGCNAHVSVLHSVNRRARLRQRGCSASPWPGAGP